jgi:hypothetical protein
MQLMILWLMSCKGCGSCWYLPPLPVFDAPDPTETDTSEPDPDPEQDDTGRELPPLSYCTVPEEEPNNEIDDAQVLPLEQWACGTFETAADSDYFSFDIDEASWIRVWVRASDLGSLANPRLFLLDAESGDYSATVENGYLSEDIDVTVKLDKPRPMSIGLFEENLLFGEEYEWRMRVSVVKAPVEWNTEESEVSDPDASNDAKADADAVADGDRVYGWVESPGRYDWFDLELGADKVDVVIETEAWRHRSPLDPELVVIDPNGDEIAREEDHDSYLNRDAKVRFTATEGGHYKIRVGSCCDDPDGVDGRRGGNAYWYVLAVTVDDAAVSEEDTADGADTDDTGAESTDE